MNKNKIKKEMINGAVVTCNNKDALLEPRFYKLDGIALVYSDDKISWNISKLSLDELLKNDLKIV